MTRHFYGGVTSVQMRASTAGAALVALAAAASGASAATFIAGGSLLISTTTYSDTGAVAGLVAGSSKLPGKNAGQA